MTKNNPSCLSGPLVNKCLVAMPGMPDIRFAKSVVYICSDNEENGTMGFVINKPTPHVAFSEILLQLKLPLGDQKFYPQVLSGGPVDGARGFILHTLDYLETETNVVTDHIGLTATVDVLQDIAFGQGPHKYLLTLGYSSWEAGQLEAEIAGNSWLVLEATEELVFDCPLQERWKKSLTSLGIDPLMLSLEQGSV